MDEQAVLQQLALASASIRDCESMRQPAETREHQSARLALMAADSAAHQIASPDHDGSPAQRMSAEQIRLNQPHYSHQSERDWPELIGRRHPEQQKCRMVTEATTLDRWHECARQHGSERRTPCLSCDFLPDDKPDPPGPDPRDKGTPSSEATQGPLDSLEQAFAALEHLRAAAASMTREGHVGPLIAIGECGSRTIRMVHEAVGERRLWKHGHEDHRRLNEAYDAVNKAVQAKLGDPSTWFEAAQQPEPRPRLEM